MWCSAAVLPLLFAALAGVFLGDVWSEQAGAGPFAAGACLLAFLTLLALRRRQGTTIAACLGVACGFGALAAQQPSPPGPSAAAFAAHESLWRAEIISTPSCRGTAPKTRRVQAMLRLHAQMQDGLWHPEQGQAVVSLWAGPELVRGDRVQLCLRVRPLQDTAPPWGRSLYQQTRARQVSVWATACGMHALEYRAHGLAAASDRARQRTALRLQQLLGPRAGGIAQALALGDTGTIAQHQRDAWGDAGIAHLLAVSGLHVGLVARWTAAVVWWLLALHPALAERFSLRRLSALAALPVVWGYALFTGGAVSAQRAALMLSMLLIGQVLGRGPSGSAHAMGLAGLAVLCADPLAAASPSFWLSFVCVACLLGAPVLTGAARGPGAVSHRLWRRVFCAVAGAMTVGLITAVGTAPLSALFFGRFSVVAPWVNLVAVPIGGLVATPLAIAAAVAGAYLPQNNAALQVIAWCCAAVLHLLDDLAAWACSLPYAAMQTTPWTLRINLMVCLMAALVWAYRLASLARPWGDPVRLGWFYVVAAAAGSAVLVWPGVNGTKYAAPRGTLSIWHLDVGQGDCALINLPDGAWVLVDAGGASWEGQADPGRWAVATALRALGVTALSTVVLTHPHPDHMNGLKHVLERWPVTSFWRNADAQGSPQVAALERLVLKRGGKVGLPPAHSDWGGGVHVQAILPLVDQKASANDHSIVLRLTYKQRSVLLMGDAEHAAEVDVDAELRPSEILKVGHHGSRTSSSAAFLRRVGAKAAIVSCGAHNTFGHPHQVTLDALKAQQTQILRTDTLGPIRLHTDGETGWLVATRATLWRPQLL